MKIFLSGIHGIGKTTFVNSLILNKPIVKYVDTDMLSFDGVGFKQQMRRLEIFDKVLESMLHTDFDCICDRSPFDFFPYNSYLYKKNIISGKQYITLTNNYQNLLSKYIKMSDSVVILVEDDFEKILERIGNRNRKNYREDDEEFNRDIYDIFYGNYTLDNNDFIRLDLSDLGDKIKSLLS